MFEFDIINTDITGELIYNEQEKEFGSNPQINSDIIFLAGYINIGFDSETQKATQIWGFHHNFNWEEKTLNAPPINKGIVKLNIDVDSGDSIRIKEADSWRTYQDKNSGWIRFGDINNSANNMYIEFFKNTVMEINKDGSLVALWLRPAYN